MKKIFFVAALFTGHSIVAQNVGIGTVTPQQKLDVNGAIKIGTSTTNQPGTVRFNAGKFEGGDGTSWKSFEQTASGIVGTEYYNNPFLLNAGYSLFGEIPGIKSYNTSTGLLPGLQWWSTYTTGIVTNIPAPVSGVAVWNGSLMYVATAYSGLYSYNPTTDIWSIVSNQGFPDNQSQAIWTGTEIIFWSGGNANGTRYNPSTNTWVNLPLTNAPSARAWYSMIWDGSRVIIWGGLSTAELNSGAMYNPSTNTWTTMNTSGAPLARLKHTAIWNNVGGRMIIWGGTTTIFGVSYNTGAIFNPVSNTWTGATNITGSPAIRENHTAVWTGTEMIIFGGFAPGNQPINTGGKYNPLTNSWTATSISGAYSVSGHAAAWTGTAMVITGGANSFGAITGLSNSYNPITDLWTNIGGFDDGKRGHYSFYANNMIIVWGGINSDLSASNKGSRYFLTDIFSSVTTTFNGTLYLYKKN